MTARAAVALGLDAGGTQMRWALADATGEVLTSGAVGSISAVQLGQAEGRQAAGRVLDALVAQIGPEPRVHSVCAGVSGVGAASEPEAQTLQALLAQALGLSAGQVRVTSDVELAYRAAFAPGQGYLVYAGTGSIAAFLDASGSLQRAGGRGGILDDGGGGFWIAREALRQIWRAEDERPGAWRESFMAQQVFARLGGSDWATTRRLVYAGSRGAMGELALAVAAAAPQDPQALHILQQAGAELARLAHAMLQRFGPRPLALAGRVAQLHPAIEAALRAALPQGQALQVLSTQGHVAAARMAAQTLKDPA